MELPDAILLVLLPLLLFMQEPVLLLPRPHRAPPLPPAPPLQHLPMVPLRFTLLTIANVRPLMCI